VLSVNGTIRPWRMYIPKHELSPRVHYARSITNQQSFACTNLFYFDGEIFCDLLQDLVFLNSIAMQRRRIFSRFRKHHETKSSQRTTARKTVMFGP
jgi:hypothetical protein